jgi:hypothetical protein
MASSIVDWLLSICKFRQLPELGASMVWSLVRVILGIYLTGSVVILGWYASVVLRRATTSLVYSGKGRRTARLEREDRRRNPTSVICIDSHWRFGTSAVAVQTRELLESQEQTRRAW